MKILVGCDGSVASKAAVELAIKHAKAFNAEVIACNSLMVPDTVEKERAEKVISDVEDRFKAESIPLSTHVIIRGMEPGEDLVRFAEENEVDEIFIGLKKMSKIEKLVFGSNAQYILLNASCPVVSAKE